jgi:hypothetical protein
MSAPASVHADTRAALLEIYQILRGAALRAREQRAATVDSAGPARPPRTGDQSEQHDARAIPTKGNAGAAGDDHRALVTSTADQF